MSLRSRTLRARLLRLSRRAMRLTARRGRDEAAATGLARTRFSQLLWRRGRLLPSLRERVSALHLYESHFLIRPDVRVSLQMHLAAPKVGRAAAVVVSGSARQRRSDTVFATGPNSRLRRTHSLSESPPPHRLRVAPPALESSVRAASLTRRLIAGVLMSWPARVLARPEVAPHPATPAAREATGPLAEARSARNRVAPMASRLERRRPPRHESSHISPCIPPRLIEQSVPESHPAGRRLPAFQPAARLRVREPAAAGAIPANLLMWRDVAPVTLRYANPRATPPQAAHIEHTTAAAKPAVARSAQPATHSARAVVTPVLDRAATDRLADEVIRRIERRVRVERERRGI